MFDLSGKTALVTGASGGIGGAIARALHARGMPIALVTNKAERYTHPLLQELGAAEVFALLVCGDTLPEKKPSAAPLLHVCEKFGIEPSELLMIGDSVNDALTARNAGCPGRDTGSRVSQHATLGHGAGPAARAGRQAARATAPARADLQCARAAVGR